MKHKFVCLGLLALFCAACTSAPPRKDSVMGQWQVMVSHTGKPDMLCYAGASPVKTSGSIAKREGKPYLMATRRPSGKIEISAYAGYNFARSSKVELVVEDEAHSLFFERTIAWARNDADDNALIEAMRNAEDDETIELRGVSEAGLTSVDVYSPRGFAAAVARIREICP